MNGNPLPIELPQLATIWVAILFASLLRSFTGFGFALAAVPIFSIFLSPVQSVVLCASLSLFIGIITLPNYHDKKQFPLLWPLLLMSLVGTPLGAFFLADLPLRYFKFGIGVAVVISSILLNFHSKNSQFNNRASGWKRYGRYLAGFLSGLLNGAFSIPGPPIILYVMSTISVPKIARSIMISFFTLSAALAIATYALHGFVTKELFYLFFFSTPIMWIGEKMGHLLFRRYGNSLYRLISLITLFFIGIFSLAQALQI